MDVRKPSEVIEAEPGHKLGVAGGRRCASCGVVVHWRIEKFCLQFREKFGGRIYCMRCQAKVLKGA